MPHNGEPDGSVEEVILNLRMPNSMSEEEQEAIRDELREEPWQLDYYVEVDDLFGYVMGTPGIGTETKEYFVRGLAFYIGGQEVAYAVMVRLYVEEICQILHLRHKDDRGVEVLRERVLLHYSAFKFSSDGPVH